MNYRRNSIIAALCFVAAQPFSAQKRNVLFIMADDFNHWLKAIDYYPQSVTPHLDNLARKGVLFSQAYSSSPVCNPSRNALWSGMRPATTGIDANDKGFFRDIEGFENVFSMNQYFKRNGYFVYGAGKLYHPGSMGGWDTDPANWSQLNSAQSGSQGGTVYFWKSPTNQEGGLWEWGAGVFDLQTNANDTKLANSVASLIKNYHTSAHANQPFFIACGLFRPHLPWKSHKMFWDLFDPDTLKIPQGYLESDLDDIPGSTPMVIHNEITNAGKWKEGIRAYLANLAYADSNAAVILDALNTSRYKDSTIIVFVGDHGWHLGEKKRWSKYSVYEQANHTTLIIYDPMAKGNGTVCRKTVSMQDIYPTLVEIAGLPHKPDIEGVSLAPLLENPSLESWESSALMTLWGINYLKTDKWKYISNGAKSELYNVENDPWEWNNLITNNNYTPVVTMLQAKIDSIVGIGSTLKNKLLYPTTAPNAPALLTVKQTGQGMLFLSWLRNNDSIPSKGYIIEQKRGEETFAEVNRTTTFDTSLVVTGLTVNETYSFRVKAYNNSGVSDFSNTVDIKLTNQNSGIDTFYTIESRSYPGRLLSSTDGLYGFTLTTSAAADATRWKKVTLSANNVWFENKFYSGKYLASTTNPSKIMLTTKTESTAQWNIMPTDGGYFYLENVGFGLKRLKCTNETTGFDLTSDTGYRVQWRMNIAEITTGANPVRTEKQKYKYLLNPLVDNHILHLDLTYADMLVPVAIYNSMGQQLYKSSLVGEEKATLHLPNKMPKGVYVLTVDNGRETVAELFTVL